MGHVTCTMSHVICTITTVNSTLDGITGQLGVPAVFLMRGTETRCIALSAGMPNVGFPTTEILITGL